MPEVQKAIQTCYITEVEEESEILICMRSRNEYRERDNSPLLRMDAPLEKPNSLLMFATLIIGYLAS